MYYLYSIQKGTSRQAAFGIWGEPGTNDTKERWPLTLLESHGEYTFSREIGEAETLICTLPEDVTGVQMYDALALSEGLLPWVEQRAWIRAKHFEVDGGKLDDFEKEELADFDAGTEMGPRLVSGG